MLKFLCGKKAHGSISILLAIIFIPIFSLTSLMVEVGRYQCAKQIFNEAIDSAQTSMLAGYDKNLQSRFGLLAMDEDKITKESLLDYVYFNSNLSNEYNVSNLSGLYSVSSVNYETMYNLADKNVLKRQIMEYGKFRIPLSALCEFLEISDMIKNLKKKLGEIFPLFKNILDLINVVEQLVEAFTTLYELECSVAELNSSVEGKGILEKGISIFKDIFDGKDEKGIGDYKPHYNEAYKDLIGAIDEKIQFLKNNDPAPTHPGPEPDDGSAAYSALQNLENQTNPKASESAIASARAKYEAIAEKHDKWAADKEKYDNYITKLESLNSTIESKVSDYKEISKSVLKNLTDYLDKITKVQEAMKKADEGLKKVNDIKEAKGKGDSLYELVKELGEAKTHQAIDFFNILITSFDGFNVDSISKNSVAKSLFKEFDVKAHYMGYAEAAGYSVLVNEAVKFDQLSQLGQFCEMLEFLQGMMNLIPTPSDDNYDVVLGDPTYNILPSVTKSGLNQKAMPEDEAYLNAILKDASDLIGSKYGFDISSITPTNRQANWENRENILDKVTDTISAMERLIEFGRSLTSLFPLGIITSVFKLSTVINDIITVFDNFKCFIKNFETTFDIILQSLYEGLIINGYITTTFPNRRNNIKNCKLDSMGVQTETQTFSGAQVEYIINGSRDEKVNQSSVYWNIFLYRVLINIVAVLMDEMAMEIISACNVFAILVFPLWVYIESILDMNFLVVADAKIPLIKTTIILSIDNFTNGLKELGVDVKGFQYTVTEAEFLSVQHSESLTVISTDHYTYYDYQSQTNIYYEKITEEEFSVSYEFNPSTASKALKNKTATQVLKKLIKPGDGILKMNYTDYMWFLLLGVSAENKMNRVADLVQMERRYGQLFGGKVPTFMMDKADTYIRTTATAEYNPILPVVPLGDSDFNFDVFKLSELQYSGY